MIVCGMRYKQCSGDHTLFSKHYGRRIAIIAVYFNDIMITRDDEEEILQLKMRLEKEFEVKDLGRLKYFLGIEIVAKIYFRSSLRDRNVILQGCQYTN
jgi:Reverse transcriptase (RNA-dependent DNA polymerase)